MFIQFPWTSFEPLKINRLQKMGLFFLKESLRKSKKPSDPLNQYSPDCPPFCHYGPHSHVSACAVQSMVFNRYFQLQVDILEFYSLISQRFPSSRHWNSTDLMHDDVLLISFTTTPRSHVVSARFFHTSCWYSFQFLSSGNICILNVKLGVN